MADPVEVDPVLGPQCDAADLPFGPLQLLSATMLPLQVPTVGTRVRLLGTNFGLNPVVLAGLSAAPATLCVANHTFLDVVVPPGEGSGLLLSTAGFQVQLMVAMQSTTSVPLRMSYAAPVVTAVRGDGPTLGGSLVTVEGANFGVTAPSIWLGSGTFATAVPCPNVTRVSHLEATCVLPVGSGMGLRAFVTVADLPRAGPASGGSFAYNPPVIDVITTLDLVTPRPDGSVATLDDLANETYVWRRSVVVDMAASASAVNASTNFVQGGVLRGRVGWGWG
jgi:hypothetical protein